MATKCTFPDLDHELGYKKETVVQLLKDRQCIPELFFQWMKGQTFSVSTDGHKIYHQEDILRYLNNGGINAPITD